MVKFTNKLFNQKAFAPIILIIILGVLIVATGTGGYYAFYKNSSESPPINENNQLQNQSSTTAVSGTEDWKTYRNDEYGFEFKYPSEYIVHLDLKNGDRYTSLWPPQIDSSMPRELDPRLSIFVENNSSSLNEKDFFIKNLAFDYQYQEVKVNTYNSIRWEASGMVGSVSYLFINGNKAIIMDFGGFYDDKLDYKLHGITNKILSTFKLIPSSSDISDININNWKTYKNEKYGFELKYPNWNTNGYIIENGNYINLWPRVELPPDELEFSFVIIFIEDNIHNLNVKDFFKKNILTSSRSSNAGVEFQELKINNRDVIVWIDWHTMHSSVNYIFIDKNKAVNISFRGGFSLENQDDKKLLDGIISTFKFIQ